MHAADVYNRARTLIKAFQALRSLVDNHRAEIAQRLFWRRLLWAWRKWAVQKREGPTARVLERFREVTGCCTVGEYSRRRVWRGVIRVWRRVIGEKRARAEGIWVASMKKRAWQKWVQLGEERKERVAAHTKRWGLQKVGSVMWEWRGVVLRRREGQCKVRIGRERVDRRLKADGLAAWKAYHEGRYVLGNQLQPLFCFSML
jgi:hypothetical protein